MTPNERRTYIIEAISARRFVTKVELCEELGVSLSTLKRDIRILMVSYPLESVSGNSGGIKAMDGWFLYKHYLSVEQQAFLEEIQSRLEGEEYEQMQKILISFGNPKSRERSRRK